MKEIYNPTITVMLFFVSSAHAGFIPSNLLDTDLDDQSTYAAQTVNLGAGTTVGGNVQGFKPITTGAGSVISGNVSGGTTVTTGADSSVGGYIEAGTTVTTGANSSVGDYIEAGTTVTTGADASVGSYVHAGTTATTGAGASVVGSIFSGTTATTGGLGVSGPATVGGGIEAGGLYTSGAGALVSGAINDQLAFILGYVPPAPPPAVINQKAQFDAVQATLNQLGVTEGSTNLDITFGISNETLTSGVYDSLNYLSMRADQTLTLDGEGVEGDFLFNIHNYLDFAAGSKVELINFTDNSKVIWNVIGDAVGSSGYVQAAANVSMRGFIFANGYVNTGANTTLFGVGDSCGGAVSVNDYILFGADNTIGAVGCDTSFDGTSNLSVDFISSFEAGLDSLLQATVNGSGYLNIWVDWDQNGQFETDEQLVFDRAMTTGTETFLADAPYDVIQGTTLARARYNSVPGVSATGELDGEVENYEVIVLNSGYSLVSNNPYFLAFEDMWPEKGDYDFNDVVIRLASSLIVTNDNQVKQLKLEGELKAMGASYHNGFAIQLQGITNSDIDQAAIVFDINGQTSSVALLEEGTAYTVLKISDDLWKHVKPDTSCWYYKTQPGCSSSSSFSFSVTITFITGIPTNNFPSAPFNPFIFATPDTDHGSVFSGNPGRGLEIHLKNKPPTSLANETYFGLSDDASNPNNNHYYQTSNGLPWGIAINIGESESWLHPYEWVNTLRAYPQFEDYAASNGVTNPAWFQNSKADLAKTYH
ncbi:MAG: LruC domain-containing protein [Gammaproteobacteria bacterium]|jgi:LruC domain-containing protein